MNEEEKNELKKLGIPIEAIELANEPVEPSKMRPVAALGIGAFCLVNIGVLLSLPPVLRGRGAPYLPTFQKNLDAMFSQLRKDPILQQQVKSGKKLSFVDLGSGDGRVVFRAAKEGIFHKCIGYEINPMLHLFAQLKRLVLGPATWSSTDFALRDIWKTDLRGANVVAVYGLGPIMKDLGVKLQDELPSDAFVLSNVFSIPGWKPSDNSPAGIHIYAVPQCWQTSQEMARKQRRDEANATQSRVDDSE